MNKKLTLLYISIFCIICTHCKVMIYAKPVNYKVYTKTLYNKSNTLLVNLKIPQIKDSSNKNNFKIINNDFMKIPLETVKTQRRESIENYQYSIKNNIPFRNFQVDSEYMVHLLKDNFLSITEDIYTYSGGAHGMTERIPFNYEISTGKQLKLKDIFPTGYDYKTIIDKYIKNEMDNPKENLYYFENSFKGINSNTNFYLEENNLVIFFPLYEIAPYALGIPEFKIPVGYFNKNLKI